MKIDTIKETTRKYVIRIVDKMNDFEDVEVEIATEHLNPESKYFTHCNVKLNTLRYRTIWEHIEYYEAICRGLRELRYLLKEQKYSNPILLNKRQRMQKNNNTIHDYTCFEDLLQKLGYRGYKPRIGSVGRALLEAGKNQRSNNVIKRYWDSYFKKLRQQQRIKQEDNEK